MTDWLNGKETLLSTLFLGGSGPRLGVVGWFSRSRCQSVLLEKEELFVLDKNVPGAFKFFFFTFIYIVNRWSGTKNGILNLLSRDHRGQFRRSVAVVCLSLIFFVFHFFPFQSRVMTTFFCSFKRTADFISNEWIGFWAVFDKLLLTLFSFSLKSRISRFFEPSRLMILDSVWNRG